GSAPLRRACARRHRRRPRRATRARGARRPGERGAVGRRRPLGARHVARTRRVARHRPRTILVIRAEGVIEGGEFRSMPAAITITLPDGTTGEYERGTTGSEIAASIGKRLAADALAAKVDGEWVDLDRPIDHDAKVAIVTPASADGREVLRHSTAHVMA